MNPTTTTDPTAPPPQPPPAQPPRSSFSCDRHPNEQFNGFCPLCLCERLTTLDPSSSNTNTPSSSRRPSSASAAIKSLFSKPPKPVKESKPSVLPELRRTKSFSASKNEALGLGSFEPQRKSCDVRGRSTLWTLFSLDDESKCGGSGSASNSTNANKPSSSSHQNHQSSKKVESCVVDRTVFEETENEEDFRDPECVEDDGGGAVYDEENDGGGDEIRPVLDSHLENLRNGVEFEVRSGEIVEEEEEKVVVGVTNLKPMKDHTDQEKKNSGGGFWAAASVFSKKWQKWRNKQKMKKRSNGGDGLGKLPVEKPISRQFRETQSEIADYGFGRRSCDTDPRFSLDAGRMSFDDPRYSFDEPRASWDGYLMGRSFPRMAPMVSVMEDAPALRVPRSDMQIPVELPSSEEGVVPGGMGQTREYYQDSTSRRRKSLDRSSSIRKTAAAVVAEIDELKMPSNAKVSPTTADYFHGAKVVDHSNSQSLRDDYSETFELGSSGFRDCSNSVVIGNGDRKESKKSRGWKWRIWGFIQRRGNNNKDGVDEEKYSRVNGVERSMSESWQDLRGERNGDFRGGLNRNALRSNSSVSWRNNNHIGSSFGSMRKSGVEMNGQQGKKKRDEVVLERNRSARYSPSHGDNGLLRFYLTPMRNSRKGGLGKIKPNNSHSIARSVLRLY